MVVQERVDDGLDFHASYPHLSLPPPIHYLLSLCYDHLSQAAGSRREVAYCSPCPKSVSLLGPPAVGALI